MIGVKRKKIALILLYVIKCRINKRNCNCFTDDEIKYGGKTEERSKRIKLEVWWHFHFEDLKFQEGVFHLMFWKEEYSTP